MPYGITQVNAICLNPSSTRFTYPRRMEG